MRGIPRDRGLDATRALLKEGYRFISNRCERYGTDVFETRLALQKAVCMRGEEAARVFYGGGRFTRRHALPPTTMMLLQDRGSVQMLDGEAHRHRKRMLMSLMMPDAIERLADTVEAEWERGIGRWRGRGEVVLHDAVRAVLCRAACSWAGVPLTESEAARRTREFSAMIDGAGTAGPKSWWGLLLRMRTERWARGIIDAVRAGELDVEEGSAAHVIAHHRNPDDEPLKTKFAGVELINVLRPTVAVARYVVFAALALHEHPEWRERLSEGEDDDVRRAGAESPTGAGSAVLERFVHEVRRYYPFFPLIAGRVRERFDWRGRRFEPGTWVLLDLYGTNHDPRIWNEPDAFRPERFRRWTGSAYNFVPQGGGDHEHDHRCAGEWITIELMKRSVRLLTSRMAYEVPEQDLDVDLSKMPALPESGFVITGVRRTG